jgi:hypothetical protein
LRTTTTPQSSKRRVFRRCWKGLARDMRLHIPHRSVQPSTTQLANGAPVRAVRMVPSLFPTSVCLSVLSEIISNLERDFKIIPGVPNLLFDVLNMHAMAFCHHYRPLRTSKGHADVLEQLSHPRKPQTSPSWGIWQNPVKIGPKNIKIARLHG